MATAQEVIDALTAEVTEATTIMDGATIFITGVPGLIATAVQQALENGATAAQLVPLTDLQAALDAKGNALKAALQANVQPAQMRR